MKRALALLPTVPPDRGRLLTPVQVAQIVGRSPAWVRANVPNKITLGHRSVFWYELDVKAWVEAHRAA